MTNRPSPRAILIGTILAAVVVTGGVASAVAVSGGADAAAGPPQAATNTASTSSAGGMQDPVAPADSASRTEETATRVEIPSIGVDSTLEQLPLDAVTGELTPPVEWLSAGWYRDGTVPGDIGPAVIAGHVDSPTGPAVFARLGELVDGDEIRVTLSDGSTSTFAVDSRITTPKDSFPTEAVYGPTPNAQLRLITCDGIFDAGVGHYVDNLIVNATLVG